VPYIPFLVSSLISEFNSFLSYFYSTNLHPFTCSDSQVETAQRLATYFRPSFLPGR
jgi:hypothetical protein